MAETVTHMSSHMDLQGNSAVTVVTDAGRVHVHYRHIEGWIELPPVPGTKSALLLERVSEEARAFYDQGYLSGQKDRVKGLEMHIGDYSRMPDPWREGYDAGKGNYPHKFTKEVCVK